VEIAERADEDLLFDLFKDSPVFGRLGRTVGEGRET
jgi:hypothetical protein